MYRWNLAPTHKGCVKSHWGLNEVPCVESYKGLIFGNWDTSAPGLRDYLGDIAWLSGWHAGSSRRRHRNCRRRTKVGDQLQLEIPGRAVRQ